MELNDILNVLIQSAELAQKGGILTLEEAGVANNAIELLKSQNVDEIKQGANALVSIAGIGQKRGAYTLKDAYVIFVAISSLAECFEPKEKTEKE